MDPSATGTVRGEPRLGSTILTPHGVETIARFDFPRDVAVTERGNEYTVDELRAPQAPEDHSDVEMEAWLNGPDFILVKSVNIGCTCSCKQCCYLVVIRGDRKTAVHQPNNDACTCISDHSCCGYPL